jgi:Flp pilus assembly protein TadD
MASGTKKEGIDMKRVFLAMILWTLLLALAVPGCRSIRHSGQTGTLPEAGSWASSEAVMRAAETTGNIEMGIAAGEMELEARPDNREARIFLARLQTRAGLVEQALYTLEPLSGDTSAAARLELARALMASGKAQEAQESLAVAREASHSDFEDRMIRKLQAIGEDLGGRHDEAQKMYAQLLVEKDEPSVRFNYGNSLFATRQYKEAVAVLTPLLDMPKFVKARYMAAAALSRQNDKAGARNLLESYLPESEIQRILGSKI